MKDKGFDVPRKMMDRDERQTRSRCSRFGERHPDEERTDQTRALRHGNGAELTPIRPCVVQRSLDDAANVPNVLPRGQLRHHAATLAMNLRLRGDDVRTNGPRTRRVTR